MTIAQYDTIGDRYNDLTNLQTGMIQLAAIQRLIGNVKGLTVLELACGTGSFTRKAVEWGATKAVGLDISQAMVEAARFQARGDDRIEFHVVDCGKPFDVGRFDVVLTPWLLNYATTEDQLLDMWRNVYGCLKPGGRVVGISPNLDLLESKVFPEGPQFGQSLKVVGELPEVGGLEVQVTLHTRQAFSFNNYYLPRGLYEKIGKLAGLRDIQWPSHVRPDIEGLEWDYFLLCPTFNTYTATRPVD